MKVKGADYLKRKLKNLGQKGAVRAMKKATRAGTAVYAKALKAAVPVDKGLLKRAQTSKISNGRRYGIAGIAGADVSKLEAAAETEDRPSNIDWLVNEGHVMPDGTVVPPEGYREQAEATATPAALAAYVDKLITEIENEAMKG